MKDERIEEVTRLREMIEKEEDKKLDCAVEALTKIILEELDMEEGAAAENTDTEDRQNKRILTLLCLVVDVECQLVEAGYQEYVAMLREDLQSTVTYVQTCEIERKISKSVISDTIDLLLSTGNMEERCLQEYMPQYVLPSRREKYEIREAMYWVFTQVAKELMAMGRLETAGRLIEKLCSLSRIRNGDELHLELELQAFRVILEDLPEAVCRIAETDAERYEGELSEYVGDFYWFYASALWQIQERSKAAEMLGRCYLVRKALLGENNWYTARAGRDKAYIDYCDLQSQDAGRYLLDFVHKTERREYENMEEPGLADYLLADAACILLMKKFKTIVDFAEYDFLVKSYERVCRTYPEMAGPCVNMRLAWGFKGNYYMQCGEYLLAEDAFRNALMSKEPGAEQILSDEEIKANLLVVYSAQNNIEESEELFAELLDDSSLEVKKEYGGISYEEKLRIYTLKMSQYSQAGIEVGQDELSQIKEFTSSLCKLILTRQSPLKENQTAALFIYIVASYQLQNNWADPQELRLYLDTLNQITEDLPHYKPSEIQRYVIILGKAMLSWNLGLPEHETEQYVNEYLAGIRNHRMDLLQKSEMYAMAAAFFGKSGKYSLALDYMENALECLTEVWHGFVKYANDTRLLNILDPVQKIFLRCYMIFRHHWSVEQTYEQLLRFKMLASLAGRERNRILHDMAAGSETVKKINEIQDRLAALATEDIFQEHEVEYKALETELRQCETEFSAKFPEGAAFQEITWERVQEAIPENTVVLEYIFCGKDYGRTVLEEEQDDDVLVMDLYVLRKMGGHVRIKRYVLASAETIIQNAEQFVAILQEKSENGGISERDEDFEELRYDLYRRLLEPAMEDIGEIPTVCFAPDSTLVNLPFERLYDEESLEETHQVVKIECARDFLFSSSDNMPTKGSLVLGNPEYEIRENEISYESYEMEKGTDNIRIAGEDLEDLEPLPFSEIEAERVAYYLGTVPWVGKHATKAKVLNAEGYQNLHIATHGFFDLSGETKAIYSSCLLFAGAGNWLNDAIQRKEYGNGIVTADEISRLDLRAMKLVVLSSCLNGRSEIHMNKGFQGMVGAFAAAGAEYVIAHLWDAPDAISTVILMDTFYYCYVEENMEPPRALAKAKEYLKTLSIREMREQGWFDYVRNSQFDVSCKESMEVLEECDDRLRPYRNEMFWGGFSCYRCN